MISTILIIQSIIKDVKADTKIVHYAKCPSCKDFFIKTPTSKDAKAEVEKHEKECHKGKLVSTFGTHWITWATLSPLEVKQLYKYEKFIYFIKKVLTFGQSLVSWF